MPVALPAALIVTRLIVKIDRELCQGHSVCIDEVPEVFRLGVTDSPYPQVELITENPPPELLAKLKRAERYCPNGVIRIIEVE